MNREDLNIRIEKTKENLAKAIKARDKYFNQLSNQAKEYAQSDIGYSELRQLNLNYNDENNLWYYRDKKRLVNELTQRLEKYENSLKKLDSFEKQDKVEAIWQFLLRWKEDTFNKVLVNAQLLGELRANYNKALEEYKEANPEEFNRGNWRLNWESEKRFDETYYASIFPLTYQVYLSRGKIDEKKLNKILDRDIETKYKNIEAKVKKVCGEITDASDLKIANNGMINGYIEGTLGKAYVETIVAGGYNQDIIVNTKHGQIAHYRVILHPVHR